MYKNKDDFGNYRPISLLPGFSKVFEIVMCARLMEFMTECGAFSKNQHGFLATRSTQTAIFQFTHAILRHLEEGNMALGMLLDLSKAFDCLDRRMLLKKLSLYGIKGRAHDWFRSYLSNRTQRVVINKDGIDHKSEISQSTVGVPQGSILGPVLFVIFMNDINLEINHTNFNITQYADDTNLLVKGLNINEISDNASNIFHLADSWFQNNKLCLNKEKTNTILFRTKQNRTEKPEQLLINLNEFKITNSTKFLGIYIDEFLDWSTHIDYLNNKLNQICYCLRFVSKYLDESSRRILYFANFEGTARYGIIFWASNSRAQDIFVTQKRVIRIIYKLSFLESCRGVFRTKNIFTIYALYIFELIMFVFRNREKMFVPINQNYNTRTRDIPYPIHHLTLFEKSPYYMGIKFYNKLDNDIKGITPERKFKQKLKSFLINLEPYCLDDFMNS